MLGEKLEILRKYFIEGKGKKQIAREMKISRNTVKSYINEFSENKKDLITSGCSEYELIENMLDKPKYNVSSRMPVVMTDEIKDILNKFIKTNEVKIAKAETKLLMTAKDMHEELIEAGFQLSYPSVAQYVQKYKHNMNSEEAFIKQHYEYGEVCEFDWGDVTLVIEEKSIRIKMAVFTLAKSGYRHAYLYRHENTQCFVDSHIRFFKHIEGVPKTMVYDNMKVAVAKFIGRNQKEATTALKQMALYYGFKYRFCNIASGNEKGHVENSVEFVRRKAFSRNNIFANVAIANEHLEEKLLKHNNIQTEYRGNNSPKELLAIEQGYLSELMPEYSNCICLKGKTDKLSTISYLQNRYSVPDYLVGKTVDIRVFLDNIKIYFRDNLVAEHTRVYGKREWCFDINHFRKTLSKKPGALVGSLAFAQMNEYMINLYKKHFAENPREFIFLLDLIGNSDIQEIKRIITKLEEKKIPINPDNIKIILNRQEFTESVRKTGMQEEIEEYARKHLKQYDLVSGTKNISEVAAV